MRLAAIYIPGNVLPHVFGIQHKGQTLNLGGNNYYSFSLSKNDPTTIKIKIKKKNSDFLNNFWGQNLSLVSAIVGGNGTGKTSVLRAINDTSDLNAKVCILLYETINSDVYIHNKTELKISYTGTFSEEIEANTLGFLYYSPVLDFTLTDTRSPITPAYLYGDSLEEYYIESTLNNALFLSNDISEDIKNIYPDFPLYNTMKISLKKVNKYDFQRDYALANFATPHTGNVLKNEIERDLRQFETLNEAHSVTNIKKRLNNYLDILNKEGFLAQFEKLWQLEEYRNDDQDGLIHNGENFIKNLEILLLSYLFMNGVFPQTGLGAPFDFYRIIEATSFKERLNLFVEFYIIAMHEDLYLKLLEDIEEISIDNITLIKQIILSTEIKINSDITKAASVKERILHDIDIVLHTTNFHEFLIELVDSGNILNKDQELEFIITNENELSAYNKLLNLYDKIRSSFSNLPITFKLIEIRPNKKLSTGESALLSFYSIIHKHLEQIKESQHQHKKNYILLLDEPELGYHPLWKRKFVSAITNTLSILFKNIKGDRNISPNIQIVFTTHDPLTLSDIPNHNITYLSKTEEGLTQIEDNSEKKSFGANITDLLTDSFFLEDGLVGDFAKEKINSIISWLSIKKLEKEVQQLEEKEETIAPSPVLMTKKKELEIRKSEFKYFSDTLPEAQWQQIQIIDEPILRIKLQEMYAEIFEENDTTEETIRLEIQRLAEKLGKDVEFKDKEE